MSKRSVSKICSCVKITVAPIEITHDTGVSAQDVSWDCVVKNVEDQQQQLIGTKHCLRCPTIPSPLRCCTAPSGYDYDEITNAE